MKTTYEIKVDWKSIHGAFTQIDAVRGVMGRIGCGDVLGGSYRGGQYERQGVAGLARLLTSASTLRRQAWDAIHSASNDLRKATEPVETDYVTRYWSVGCPCVGDLMCSSHRGAARRSTIYGGRVEARQVLRHERIESRRDRVIDTARHAAAAAIAVHDCLTLLSGAGICDYDPEHEICGIHEGRINLTGLSWLTGHAVEPSTPPTVESVSAFASGEALSL